MTGALIFGAIGTALSFLGALVAYVLGRIILPEMGLTAPGYWPWFWVTLISVLFYGLISWFTSLLDS